MEILESSSYLNLDSKKNYAFNLNKLSNSTQQSIDQHIEECIIEFIAILYKPFFEGMKDLLIEEGSPGEPLRTLLTDECAKIASKNTPLGILPHVKNILILQEVKEHE